MRKEAHNMKSLRSQSESVLASCRKIMWRNQKKGGEKDDQWNSFSSNLDNSSSESRIDVQDNHQQVSDFSWSRRYLHITNEQDEAVGVPKRSTIESELHRLSHGSQRSDGDFAYWSHYEYLRKSTNSIENSRAKQVSFEETKTEDERVEPLPPVFCTREQKRKQRQSNRSGIPTVIILSQPLLPSMRSMKRL